MGKDWNSNGIIVMSAGESPSIQNFQNRPERYYS